MRTIEIGLLGLGNVGAGAVRILRENAEQIDTRVGASVRVKRVLVRDLARAREVDVDPELLTTEVKDVLEDADIRVVVELIGGIEPAREWVMAALRAGKHVVTANKALLAEHGGELFELATECGRDIWFEGSVAGGIPVLRVLREGLASDRIDHIEGIVNGTSNYVLDAMTRTGQSYDEALAAAQRAGFAEADPTLDVEGKDAAHKLALLCSVAFHQRVDPEAIPTEGITKVRPFDIRMAAELGYVIKSLAIGDLDEKGRPRLRVHPVLVPDTDILAGVHGANNAVAVRSQGLGRSLYYGQGAGMLPTGVAVASDIVEVCREIATFTEGSAWSAGPKLEVTELAPLDDVEVENYICAHVPNVPGVLGRVAGCLGRHGVSIQRMNQDTPGPGEPIDMVVITEKTREARVRAAIHEIDTFEEIIAPTSRIRIFDPES